jgi:hypothetical protein
VTVEEILDEDYDESAEAMPLIAIPKVIPKPIKWQPQPTQFAAITCPAEELLFGGAAGGGKSDWLLADALQGAMMYGNGFRGVLFRRSFPELEELLARAYELYGGLAKYNQQSKKWTFKNGATLKLRYIESDKDVYLYQGHQYSWIGWDELGLYPTDFAYRYLMSRLRSAAGTPCVIRATANPGGPGNAWLKNRFIDSYHPNVIHVDFETGNRIVFIPSKLSDNQILCKADPGYEKRLDILPEAQRRALKFGDWDVFSGQIFSEYRREKHLIAPFPIGPEWTKFCAMDWGYAKPYAIVWLAVSNDGRVILYREKYGCTNEPNTGLKQDPGLVASTAWNDSVGEGVTTMIADPACWSTVDGSATIAQKFESVGWTMIKADNSRVNGLMRLHELMQTTSHDGRPMLLVFNTCNAFIRTVPALVSDPKKPEDVDTTMEDHLYDALRYGCMSPQAINPRMIRKPRNPYHVTPRQDYDPLNYGLSS